MLIGVGFAIAGSLIRRLVIARRAAGLAVEKAIHTQADIDLRLAENAVFLALAARLALFTLHANYAAGSGLGGHGTSVDGSCGAGNVTEVMKSSFEPRATS